MRNCPNVFLIKIFPRFLAALDNFPFVVVFPHIAIFRDSVTITSDTPSNVETTMQQSLCITYRP